MDIEKLIESAEHCDLGDCANCPSCDRVCCKERTMGELAREVKRLQAENEKLRAELEQMRGGAWCYDAPFMRTSLRIKFCSEGQRREDEHEQ